MTEFTIALAGKNISIASEFPGLRTYCQGYLAEGKADVTVVVREEDIEYEREKSAKEDIKEGREVIEYSPGYLASLAAYRQIAEEMLKFDTFLFHGSAVCVDGQAYLFTAKSGTGKSTHTRLWREKFGDKLVVVNDDKPLLKVTQDQVLVCGTPWDGKHRISTNVSVPLKGICILRRGTENRIRPVSLPDALPLLLQQSYRPRDSRELSKLLALLYKAMKLTGLYVLECNMDPEAADVAYRGMSGKDE